MTTEVATAFAERLKTDEALVEKLAAAGREERRALAREAGYELSDADLPAIRSALGVEELSDEDLERVAGGMGATTAATIGAVSASAAAPVTYAVGLAAVAAFA